MLKKINLFILIVLIVSTGISGCVSKTKYLELDDEKVNCENREKELMVKCENREKELMKQIADYESKSSQLKSENKGIKSKLDDKSLEQLKLNEELKNQIAQLNEREKKIQELQNLIDKQKNMVNGLLETIRTALISYDSSELSVEVKNGKVYVAMSDKLLFKSGSTRVDQAGKDALKKLAEILVKQKDIDILIEGHTDNVPIKSSRFEDNWDLSVIRATSIVRILTQDYEINEKQLLPSGRGEFHPVDNNETKEGKSKNRRTEIILSPNLDDLFALLLN